MAKFIFVITRLHVALLSRYKDPLPSDMALDATATATAATDVAVAVKWEVDIETCAYNADCIATAARALREHDYCKALEDTLAAAEVKAETQAQIKQEHTFEWDSSEDRNQASAAPVVLATNHGNQEHPNDSSGDWYILSFENYSNVLEDPRKSQETALLPREESLAKMSDGVDNRTRRDDRFKNEQSQYSQGIFGTQLGNHTERMQYMCYVCHKMFQGKGSLVSHVKANACGKTLSFKECKLNQNHTLSSPKTLRTKVFACDLCKYECTTKRYLLRHMRTHTGVKPFVCTLCKYECTTKNNLFIHMRTHPGEKPFTCKLCQYKCTFKSRLVVHMRYHTGEMPFACKLCNYKCTVKSGLVRHMRTHTSEKPFACKLCKYKCKAKSDLTRHIRIHADENPFTCKLCKNKCKASSIFASHMRTHPVEKLFACK